MKARTKTKNNLCSKADYLAFSFYENKKGDEFMDWIIDSAEGIEKNKNLFKKGKI